MSLYFLTTNKGKYYRVKELCEMYDIHVNELKQDIDELEVNDVSEVSKDKAYKAYMQVSSPCFVEDSGFYIDAYPNKKNYPGTLVKRSGISSNIEDLLETMKNVENRKCHFISCVTYYDGKDFKQFIATNSGELAREKRGILPEKARSRLWEVFIPEGYNKTLAEMTEEERLKRNETNNSSFKNFIEWYVSNVCQKPKIRQKTI